VNRFDSDLNYGDEKIFFSSIADMFQPGTVLKWVGEDNEMFIWRFNGAGMKEVSVDLTNIHEYSVEDLLDK
jgi:hypothetical protein